MTPERLRALPGRVLGALRRAGSARLRVTDAVIIAAAGLLLLRAIDAFDRPPEAPSGPGPSVVHGEDLPAFARVLAYARSEQSRPQVVTTGSNPDAPPSDAAAGASAGGLAPSPTPPSPSEAALVERLAAQREELDRRLRELALREELLAAAERRLDERAAGGEPAAAAAAAPAPAGGGRAGSAPAAAPAPAESLRRLVTLYENMRPKDAARVFDRLGLEVLAPLAEAMNPRRLSEIMGLMSSEAAERLTVALAMRAHGAPGPWDRAAPAALPPTELPAIALPQR